MPSEYWHINKDGVTGLWSTQHVMYARNGVLVSVFFVLFCYYYYTVTEIVTETITK